ncbi:hypothetical protein B0H12DRAFT_1067417 [Mycena haematopus]|nr:hypothetical protein B0H12DRAFT_1072578 [Mycena haematopus]KAJ7270784.1 hypothetical protein B0H12DRAFT_1067417 [Mycena haematopus]
MDLANASDSVFPGLSNRSRRLHHESDFEIRSRLSLSTSFGILRVNPSLTSTATATTAAPEKRITCMLCAGSLAVIMRERFLDLISVVHFLVEVEIPVVQLLHHLVAIQKLRLARHKLGQSESSGNPQRGDPGVKAIEPLARSHLHGVVIMK